MNIILEAFYRVKLDTCFPFLRLVHISEFRDEVEEYTFPNTTYPWEFFRGSFEELGDKSYHKNRVLISEEREIDDSLFESSLGKSFISTEKVCIKIL